MIDIRSITVVNDMLGRAKRFSCWVRFTNGKYIAFEFDRMDTGMRRLERILTRELCK